MKKILVSPPVILIVFFVLLEVLSSFWLSGYGNSLDKTRKIVLPDEALGWRQAWNIDTTFLGERFTTDHRGFRKSNSNDQGHRVLFLGPSSTAGWGVSNNETYPSLIGKKYHVLNAGQIGFSSFQGSRLYRNELAGEEFDIVIIAYGINDVDMHRFYFQSALTDSQELADPKDLSKVSFQKIINYSSLLGVMQKMAFKLLSFTGKGKIQREQMEKLIRVKEDEFRKNLIEIIEEVRVTGAIPVLLSTSTHYKKSANTEIAFQQDLILGRMAKYSQIMREIAADKKVSLAHPDLWLTGNKDELFVDPVHFSPKGNQLIAEGLGDMIGRIIKKGTGDGQ